MKRFRMFTLLAASCLSVGLPAGAAKAQGELSQCSPQHFAGQYPCEFGGYVARNGDELKAIGLLNQGKARSYDEALGMVRDPKLAYRDLWAEAQRQAAQVYARQAEAAGGPAAPAEQLAAWELAEAERIFVSLLADRGIRLDAQGSTVAATPRPQTQPTPRPRPRINTQPAPRPNAQPAPRPNVQPARLPYCGVRPNRMPLPCQFEGYRVRSVEDWQLVNLLRTGEARNLREARRVLAQRQAQQQGAGDRVQRQQLADGVTRYIVNKRDGSQIITLRAADGFILRRVRVDRYGNRQVIVDNLR